MSALPVPGRKTIGYVYTFDDLTEIRRLERDVRIQDRLAAVGRLAAAIAHEIRNPLTSIAGSVSMLSGIAGLKRRAPSAAADCDPRIGTAEQHHHRLSGVLSGQAVSVRVVDLLPLLEDTLTLLEHRLMAENTGIRIERHYNFTAGIRPLPMATRSSKCSGIFAKTRSVP